MSVAKPKTTFEELIEVIMEVSRVTLPFLAARGDGGGNNLMLMILMPIIMLLLRRMQLIVSDKIKPVTLIIPEYHRGDATVIYEVIKDYLLLHYSDKFDLECGYNYYFDDDGVDKDIQKLNNENSEIPKGCYSILFNKNKLELVVIGVSKSNGNGESNVIKISHKSRSVLMDFIKAAKLSNKERTMPTKDEPRQYVRISHWSSSQFNSMSIRITKKRSNIFLDPALEKSLFGDIDKFLASQAKYQTRGLVWKRGYLFYGTPGCGKTSTALAIADYTDRNITIIKLNQILSSAEFDRVRKNTDPHQIIVLEEIDTIAISRRRRKLVETLDQLQQLALEYTTTQATGYNQAEATKTLYDLLTGKLKTTDEALPWSKSFNWYDGETNIKLKDYSGSDFKELMFKNLEKHTPSLFIKYTEEIAIKDDSKFMGSLTLGDVLNALDGIDCFYGCIIIATTNYPERIDDALKRRGRIDMECDFRPANAQVIRDVYKVYIGHEPEFKIPSNASITQSKLIHEFILTYEDDVAMLDKKLSEYLNRGDKVDDISADISSPIITRVNVN
jgi:hypothetical protein